VEETAAAAESMRMQTAKLSEAVAAFRVDVGAAAQASTRNASKPAHRPIALAKAAAPRPVKPSAPRRDSAAPAVAAQIPTPKASPSPAPSASEGDWETF
jgi:methyl-accepting chemotaxis protein